MNLYRIYQTVNNDYDTHDSAVVAAESEQDASMTHPGWVGNPWDGKNGTYGSWCDAKDVSVELIGEAVEGTEAGVICSSFNAG